MATAPLTPIVSLFPHERGPADFDRAIALGELREWSDLWAADRRLLPAIGDPEIEALVRDGTHRLHYFSASDPEYPRVPLLRADSAAGAEPRNTFDPRLPPGAGIRDKVWQRLFVEESGHLPQPGFAVVNGSRVEACNARWFVHIAALDCQSIQAALHAAVAPGVLVIVEGVEAGFAAFLGNDGIRLVTRSPHVAARLGGAVRRPLSAAAWDRFVTDLCATPLPLRITKAAHNPTAELGDALSHAPGSYILKPRYGSNGFGVIRVVSRADGWLTVESDCPDTAGYLEEFPADPARRGQDLVAAAAADRHRFADRARVGLSERALGESILEEEIRQDRAEGAVFEPRVVVQRVGLGHTFATLGAICKRIDTPVAACVARGFEEEPLEASLRRFLRGRVPNGDLALQVRRARDELLAAGDRLQAAIIPAVEARGARVHQLGIDCRMCWDPGTGRVEYPLLEIQFGIGRVDWSAIGEPPFAGYKTGTELRGAFGPEVG
jgi:hypothetical protein